MANNSLNFQSWIPSQLSDLESKAIALVASHLPNACSIVEVGSLFGRSAWLWANNAPADVTIYSIDPWVRNSDTIPIEMQFKMELNIRTFLNNTQGFDNIVPLKGRSPDDFLYWNKPVYLYFEDAIHEGDIFFRNLEFWSSKVVPGGIICGHAYNHEFPDVRYGACLLCQKLGGRLIVCESFWCILQPNHVELLNELLALGAYEIDLQQILKSYEFLSRHRPTRTDVINAYKLFLGRYPENEKVIERKLRNCPTFNDLRLDFINSAEFTSGSQLAQAGSKSATKSTPSAQQVELELDEESFAELLARVEGVWQNLGEIDPWWSVLTHKKFLSSNISPEVKQEFYSSGKDMQRYIETKLEKCGIEFPLPTGRAMDFGCGLGRILIHMAPYFRTITGVDISQPHLDLARKELAARNIHNVELAKVASITALSKLGEFDFVYSFIALQHNPPPIIAKILMTLLSLLKPGGIAIFQLPVALPGGYRFNVREYMDNNGKGMEMHALPQAAVSSIASMNNCEILDVEDNGFCKTSGMKSRTFICRKAIQLTSQ